MCRIVDGWKAYQAGELGDAARWQEEIMKHHKLFIDCYGKDMVRPKHHRALHFGNMLTRLGEPAKRYRKDGSIPCGARAASLLGLHHTDYFHLRRLELALLTL